MSQIKESDLDQIGGGMRFPGTVDTPPHLPEYPLPLPPYELPYEQPFPMPQPMPYTPISVY